MTALTSTAKQARERRFAVERRLAERGLLRGPRRLLPGPRRPLDSETVVRELCPVLEELGGVFAAFGLYLSLRADFLPTADCLRLEGLAEDAVASSPGAVDDRLEKSLGRPRDQLFASFEERPFEIRWLDQAHRARLPGGERVVVRLIHPGREADLERDADALAVLRGALTGEGFSTPDHFDDVLADFRRLLATRLDLGAETKALRALGREARRSHLLVVPQVYRELSSQKVSTVQWLPGSTIDEMARAGLQEVDATDVARRIGLIWLQMVLVGSRFPLAADVVELPDGRLAVTGGVFATVPDASRVSLWNYLRATVEHYPDRAAASLLRQVTKVRPDASRGELRTRVRQVVPFRDGGWSATGESLAEYALLHWHALRRVGFRARRHLDEFYQGLFWAARCGRRFAPHADPLGEALRDFDWLAGWNQLRQLASPEQMGMTAESYMSTLMELPQKIDRILSFAGEEGGLRMPSPPPRATRRRHDATAVVVSLALVMAAFVLLADQWRVLGAAAGLAELWIERSMAVAFLGLGGWLLLAARRTR